MSDSDKRKFIDTESRVTPLSRIDPHKIDDSFFPTHHRVIVPCNSDILNPEHYRCGNNGILHDSASRRAWNFLRLRISCSQGESDIAVPALRYCAQDECGGLTRYTLMALDNATYYVRVWNFQSRGIVLIRDKNVKNDKHIR